MKRGNVVTNKWQRTADTDSNWRRRDPSPTPAYLPIPVAEETPEFKDHKVIGNFKTGEECPPLTPTPLVIEKEVQPHVLLPKDIIEGMNGKCLNINFEERNIVRDYKALHSLKQNYFYRWLVDHNYFENIGNGKKWKRPDFICNEGRIVEALLTPLDMVIGLMDNEEGWQFYAIKYQNIIFLSSVHFGNRCVSTKESHCGSVYLKMITTGGTESELIDEFETLLSATEVNFGSHQLLIVAGSVEDDEGNAVEVRAYKPKPKHGRTGAMLNQWELKKFTKFWGLSVVAGLKTMVLGERDSNRVLRSTEYIPTTDLLPRTGLERHGKRCYKFINDILDLIKQEFIGDDRSIVKLVKWIPQAPFIKVEADELRLPSITPVDDPAEAQRISEFILPDWFVEGAFNNVNT